MKIKLFFVVALVTVFFISTPAPCQQEEITLSTYYPAPYGEYDELCAEKLLVDTPAAAELQDMARGDCHITNSLIVGAAGGGFSYDAIGGSLTDGTVLIKGDVGIGTTNPDTKLGIAIASAANVNDGLKIFRPDFTGSPNYDYLKFGMKSDSNTLYRGAISYVYNYGAENEIMTFMISTGNVGIGTAGPRGLLDVTSGSANTAGDAIDATIITSGNLNVVASSTANLFIQSNTAFAADTGGSIGFGGRYATGNTSGAFWAGIKGAKENAVSDNLDSYMAFYTRTSAAGTLEKMRITSTGNVGIGTTNPTAKLHIGGTAGTDGIRFPDGSLQTKAAQEPDWDSGWVFVNRISPNHGLKTWTHNLNVFPRQIQWWFSPGNPGTWIGPVDWSKQDHWSNPIGVWVTTTQIRFTIWFDRYVYRGYNATSWENYDSGYYRVLLWK